MKTLVLCSGCERHVSPDDASCPFCGAAVLARPEPPRPRRGLSRAKLHAFHTAALATGVAVAVACGGDTSPPDGGSDGSNDSTASDAKNDGTSNNDATTDAVAESGSDGSDDASADVADEDHVIPLPYGCVFPGGCKSVTV